MKRLIQKGATFIVLAIVFGAVYGWVSPRMFPKGRPYGFGYGILHGFLMPLALPSLVMGEDVQLFATDDTGRIYKIGFICGINLCGVVFLGPLFWRPNKVQSKGGTIPNR